MNLNPIDLQTLSRLLDQAMDLEVGQLDGWLAGLGDEHSRLIPQLREMLAQHRSQDQVEFMADGPRLADDTVARHGDLVGPYRLIREIGRGGMGTVWLAERADGSLKRQVALKLPRLAWGAGLAERMARERDIGALLEHPNIARLYDAGVDERGRPYLALEYIDGQPIDAWCTAKGLDVRAKLRLFVQVARAVAYAHGRLVIHRDLKPSNVLVTDDGQAHLLDFGIAKLLDDAAPEEANLTEQVGRAMTPRYASPEQLAGETMTVQSDVYSLGVLLYELLTTTLPIEPRRGSLRAVEEALLRGDAPLASSRAPDRATANALRGEVDAILAKAMQCEPARRYVTADAFARDIERHLGGETVTARPDSVAYRLRKAMRRHWVGVSATAAVLLSVLLGSATAVVQAQRVAKALQREQVVKQFVAEVLRVNAQPGEPGQSLRSAPAEVFLERSAKLVQSRFAGQPELQADLYAMVGTAFADMGASQLATEYGLRQVEALSLAGAAARDQARALLQLSTALLDQRRFEDAEQRALRAASLAEGEADLVLRSQVIVARSLAARDLLDRLDAELALIDAGVSRDGPAAGSSAAWALGLRAKLLLARNQRTQALKVLESAIDRALVAEGPDSPAAIELRLQTASALAGISSVEQQNRYFDAAIAALKRRGTEQVIRAAYELARFAAYRYRAASQISARQALATIAEARTLLADTGRVVPTELSAGLDVFEGDVLTFSGRVAAGIVLIERALPVLYSLAPGPSERRQLAGAFGRALTFGGRHELADHWHRETLRAQIEAGRGHHPAAANDYAQIAVNLSMWGRHDEALAFIDTAPDFPPVPEGPSKLPDLYNQRIKLVRSGILLDSGNAQAALREFPRALLDEPDPVDRQESLEVYGHALCESGQAARGLAALRESMRLYEQTDDDENAPWTARLRAQIGRCAFRQGDHRGAAGLAAQAHAAFSAQREVSPYYKAPLTSLERQLGLKLPPV